MADSKFYAVAVGRECNVIHDSWDKCAENIQSVNSAHYKAFDLREEAETWLEQQIVSQTAITQYVRGMSLPVDDPNTIYMYTDGSYGRRWNKNTIPHTSGPYRGGWSVVWVQMGQIVQEWFGNIPYAPEDLSSQNAELYAMGQGLLAVTYAAWTPLHIRVRSDAKSSVIVMNDRSTTYRNKWKKQNNNPLVSALKFLQHQLGSRMSFEHVFSHDVDPYNRRADKLARRGRKNCQPCETDYNFSYWVDERFDTSRR
jgi:ribonuclease HI